MDLQSVVAVIGTVLLAAWMRNERAKHKKPPTDKTAGPPPVQPPQDTGPPA